MVLEVKPDLQQSLDTRKKLDNKNIFGTVENFVVSVESLAQTYQKTKTISESIEDACSSDEEENNKLDMKPLIQTDQPDPNKLGKQNNFINELMAKREAKFNRKGIHNKSQKR